MGEILRNIDFKNTNVQRINTKRVGFKILSLDEAQDGLENDRQILISDMQLAQQTAAELGYPTDDMTINEFIETYGLTTHVDFNNLIES